MADNRKNNRIPTGDGIGTTTPSTQGNIQEQLIQVVAGSLSALLVGKVDENGLTSDLNSAATKSGGLLNFITNGNAFFTEATENFKSISDNLEEVSKTVVENSQLRKNDTTLKEIFSTSNTFYEKLLASISGIQEVLTNPNNGGKSLPDISSMTNVPDFRGAQSLLQILMNEYNVDDKSANKKLNEYADFFGAITKNLKKFAAAVNASVDGISVAEANLNATRSLFAYVQNIISLIEKLTDPKLLGRLFVLSISLDSFAFAIRKKFIPGLLQLQDVFKDDKNGDLLKIYSDIANRLEILSDVMKGVTSTFASFSEIAELDIDDINSSINELIIMLGEKGKINELKKSLINLLNTKANLNKTEEGAQALADSIKNMLSILSVKDLKKEDIDTSMDFMKALIKEYEKFFKILKESIFSNDNIELLKIIQNNTKQLKDVIENFVNLLSKFGAFAMLNYLIGIGFAINSVKDVNTLLDYIYKTKFDEDKLNDFRKLVTEHIIPLINEITAINKVSLKDILEASIKLKAAKRLFKNVNGIIGALGDKFSEVAIGALMKGMNTFADALTETSTKLAEIDIAKLKEAMDVATSFEKLIVKLSLVLLVASAAAFLINPVAILTIGASLSMLILSIGGTMLMFSKIKDDVLDGTDGAVKLVIAAGLILALATLAIQGGADIARIVVFGVLLDAFLWSLFYIFNKFGDSKAFKKTLKGAKDAMMLVALSGAILIAGSLLTKLVNWTDMLQFGVMLALFMYAISFVYLQFVAAKKVVMYGAEGFGKLVALSGATLVLGALLYRHIHAGDIIGFGFILSAFIFAVCAAYGLASKIAGEKALEISEQFAKVIAISGATLLAAGLIMGLRDDMDTDILSFAVILGIFISGVSIALGYAAKISDGKALFAIGTIGVVTFLVGGLLLFAGYLIAKNPGMLENIAWFGLITALFILANVGLITLLSLIDKTKLLGATVALIGIGAIGLLMGFTMKILSDVANDTDFDKLDKLLWRMAAVFGSLFTIVAAVGAGFGLAAATGVGGLFAGGAVIGIAVAEAALFGLIKIVDLAATAMSHLGNAAQDIDKMNGLDFSTMGKNLAAFIGAIVGATDVLDKNRNWLEKLGGGFGKATNALGYAAKFGAIIVMADAVKSIALSIKEWSDAFPEGLDSKKITSIGGTLIAIITSFTEPLKDPKIKSMFEVDWLTGTSSINQMMKAYNQIGDVLSNVGKGVQMWSSMRIPIYDEAGNIKSYVQLMNADLKTASENIKEVLIAIGEGLSKAADSNVFKASIVDKESKAVQAAKAIGIVSESLSTIAMSLAYYATGEFPILEYVDGKLQTKSFTPKIEGTLLNDAKNRITEVVGAIADALATSSHNLNGHFNVGQIATAIKDASDALNNIVGVINDIAALETNGVSLDKTQSYFETTLTSLFNLISIFDEDAGKDRNGLWGWIVDGLSGKRSKSEYIISVVDDIEELSKATQTLASQLSIFVNAIKDIVKPFDENRDVFGLLNGKDSEINQMVMNVMQSLGDSEKGILPVLSSYINQITRLVNNVNLIGGYGSRGVSSTFEKIKKILVDFMQGMIAIKSEFTEYSNDDFNMINNVFDTYNKMLETMSLTKKFDRTLDKQSLVNSINVLSDITNLMKNADQAPSKGLMTLGTNMASLSMALDALPDDEKLAKSKKVLREYMKEIDTMNVSKISSFINLVNSLDNLALRLGSLDSFTDSFVTKIMNVLTDLTTQLTEAKDTINNAHSLDENRKKLIQDSISKIKDMMKDDIIVKISADDNNRPVSSTGFTDSGGASSGRTNYQTTSFGGGDTGSSIQPPLSTEIMQGGSGNNSIDDLIKQIQVLIDTLKKTQKQDR